MDGVLRGCVSFANINALLLNSPTFSHTYRKREMKKYVNAEGIEDANNNVKGRSSRDRDFEKCNDSVCVCVCVCQIIIV